ncbi:MAG: Aldose 1-epimerase precursor [Bacteroidetes bacterium ADurb.Bin037]|nr:MAG: Aldose 1-epimerase precursor [Bacteroidetes bacterium ADurb.Bin037]HPW78075.1 aldose epimerase family protein [Bacteroidales bacterium]HQB56585.1 aldose epimerase family protein [Bacteroidales bacterium]
MEVTQYIHGYSPKGEAIVSYKITNKKGSYVQLCNIGATVMGIGVPDRNGLIEDVVPGYQDIMQYFQDPPYFGKTVGRYANRIARGTFSLEGKQYHLTINKNSSHLHGGPQSMCFKVWISRIEEGGDAVSFTYASPHGEENYPGNMQVTATFRWSEDDILTLELRAITDMTTIINLTSHTYFNLAGEGNGSIHNHILQLNAEHYLPVDETSIPLGAPATVKNTPFDFTSPKPIGKDIAQDNEQLRIGNGYDHCWCLPLSDGTMQKAAVLSEPVSGRILTIHTTQPGIQVYTGNWLSGNGKGKNGIPHKDRHAVALECQYYPDSPNKPEYPSCLLRPGELYLQKIVYAFSTDQSTGGR